MKSYYLFISFILCKIDQIYKTLNQKLFYQYISEIIYLKKYSEKNNRNNEKPINNIFQ